MLGDPFSVRLADQFNEKVKKFAIANGMTQSTVVRLAVIEFFRRRESQPVSFEPVDLPGGGENELSKEKRRQ